MIGAWSGHASTFLILLAVISALFLSIPIFVAPLRWARLLGWPIPEQTDLAVYFGRCLGGIAIVLNAITLRAGMTGESNVLVFQILLAVASILTVVHVWGAIRGVQPVSETIEIAMWAGLVLLTLACWPVA
jgi:hypothetical protein